MEAIIDAAGDIRTMATRLTAMAAETDRLHSVRRALAVLEALATRPDGATPKELSQALGLHLSTIYRLLNTLIAGGYAVRCAGGLFRLGPRVAFLNHGYLAALRPPPEALPFLSALQQATGETAMLNLLQSDDVVIAAVVAGSHPTAYPPLYVGMAAPAHAVAAGKVLLAWLPAGRREAYLARRARASGSPFPLTNPDALRAELARIREAGYALDRGDRHRGVCCVAAPVSDRGGLVTASISVVLPCSRFTPHEQALVGAVLAIVRGIGALQIATPARDGQINAAHPEPEETPQTAITAVLDVVAAAMSRVT